MSEVAFNPEFERQETASRLHTTLTKALYNHGAAEADGHFMAVIFENNKYAKYAVINNYLTAGNHTDYHVKDREDHSQRKSLKAGNPILCIEVHETDELKQSFIVCRPSDIKPGSMLHSMFTLFNPGVNLDSTNHDILSLPSTAEAEVPEIDLLPFEHLLQKLN
jgi:hypothetical protein